jgi:hypothetical protein
MAGMQVYVVHDAEEYGPGGIHGVYVDMESAEIAVEIERLGGQHWDITCCEVQTADTQQLSVAREKRAAIDILSEKTAKQEDDLRDACKDLERIPKWVPPTGPWEATWTARMDHVSKTLTAERHVRERAKALGIVDEKMIRRVLNEIVPVDLPSVHPSSDGL